MNPCKKCLVSMMALVIWIGDSSIAQVELEFGAVIGAPGSHMKIALSVSSNLLGVGLQGDIEYDPAIVITPSASKRFGLEQHSFSSVEILPGRYRFIVIPDADSLPLSLVEDSVLIDFEFDIASGAGLGTYPLTLSNVVMGDATSLEITPVALTHGSLTVSTNHSPEAHDSWVSGTEDLALVGSMQGDDLDGDTLTFSLVSNATQGVATLTDPNLGIFSYVPVENTNGLDRFTFQVTDGTSFSSEAAVLLGVSPVNDPPTFAEATIATDEDQISLAVPPDVTDVDLLHEGDSYDVTVVSQPIDGVAGAEDGALMYDPNEDFSGSDSFTFCVSDSGGLSTEGTATITVNPINDPPTFTTASLLACIESSSDPTEPEVEDVDLQYEGDTFGFSILSQGLHGTATVDQNRLLYTATTPGYFGTDQFDFQATDAGGLWVAGTADVEVVGLRILRIGPRVQGLDFITFTAQHQCGNPDFEYEWVNTETSMVIGTEATVELNPMPAHTTLYRVTVTDNITRAVVAEDVLVLVNPFGLDLNLDGINSVLDVYFVLESWRNTNGDFDADGDGIMSVLDMCYIHFGD